MNKSTALTAMALIATSLLVNFASITLPVSAENEEDHTIRPGIGLGIVKLGMDSAAVTKTAGKHDGTYSLPSGIRVDYSQWKETPPKKSANMRFFYDKSDHLIQINSTAPVPVTADGISCASSFADIAAKYKNLRCFEYRAKDVRIDYYDDVNRGIAFEFTRAQGESARRLYAIIIHLKGKRVLADADELTLAIKKAK
jgi:hypothetical protein